tara:strand:+ start:5024 stop:5311 length:288 start_codon:yes stop_codon:yes gene_type:complete
MNYKKIFNECENIINEREKAYGDAKPLFDALADRFSNVLAHKLAPGATVSAYDVARLMAELKAARLDKNGYHKDSLLDQINYLVIAHKLITDATS